MRAYPSNIDQYKIKRLVEEGVSVEQISNFVKVNEKNLRAYIKSFGWKAQTEEEPKKKAKKET